MSGYIFCFLLILTSFCFVIKSDNEIRGRTSQELHRQKRSDVAYCAGRQGIQCCPGTDNSCSVEGCYCDEYCMTANDCCPDYIRTCQTSPCNQHLIIENEEKRSAEYITDTSKDTPYSDDMLNETWYRVISNNGEEIPTYPPGVLHCGTLYPIWLNGSFPGIDSQNVTREVCLQTTNDICAERYDIQIRNCSGFYVYYLQSTAENSAYCFGKGAVLCGDGLSSESGYYPGCTSSFPNETVSPEVEAVLVEGQSYNIPNYVPTPSLIPVFKCSFDDVSNGTYVHDVYWYINENNVTIHKNIPFFNISDTFLMDDQWIDKYNMNMEVRCSIRIRHEVGSVPSPFYKSAVLNAGFYPDAYEYTVVESEYINIPFRSTVPVACIASHPDIMEKYCDQNFYIFQPQYTGNTGTCNNNIAGRDIVFESEFCGLNLNAQNWNETKYLKVYGFSDGQYNRQDRSTYIRMSTSSITPLNNLWENIQIPDIKVTVVDKDSVLTSRQCQSYNDPHITTFDGETYHYMEVGEFVMYRNNRGPYWVHALFTNCGFGWAGSSCHCGVAVRSRGSLFVLRTCRTVSRTNIDLLPRPHIEIQNCDGSDLSIDHTGNSYKITLPIGTEIRFTISYSKFISMISIKPSVYDIDSTEGLCGVPSSTKDPSDDFTHRTKGPINDWWDFANSWRIIGTSMSNEELFVDNPTFLHEYTPGHETSESNKTLAQYCVCEKEATHNDDFTKFYTVQCNLTEVTDPCVTQSDNSVNSFVTTCVSNVRKKRSVGHRISRRSLYDSDDVVDVEPLVIDEDLDANVSEPVFRNGWDEEKANKTCTERIQKAVPTDLFADVAGLNESDYVNSCILDIKLTANTVFVQDTVGTMQTFALVEVSKNETLQVLQTDDGSQTILEYITSLLCPNNCSENGNCTSGVCSCYDGYIGDDCSVKISTPPMNISLPSDGLCGTRSRACERTNIFGNFLSKNVWCKRRHFQILNTTREYTTDAVIIKAEFRNAFMVSVSLQPNRRKRSISESILAEGYELTLSNDGTEFGDVVTIIIYDEDCVSCNATSVTCAIVDSCEDVTTNTATESTSTLQPPSTSSREITTKHDTTSLSETTTNPITETTTEWYLTTQIEIITNPVTTSAQITTEPETTTQTETTTTLVTTSAQITTVPETTTQIETTTTPVTTSAQRTTEPESTTQTKTTTNPVNTSTQIKTEPGTTTQTKTTTTPVTTSTQITTEPGTTTQTKTTTTPLTTSTQITIEPETTTQTKTTTTPVTTSTKKTTERESPTQTETTTNPTETTIKLIITTSNERTSKEETTSNDVTAPYTPQQKSITTKTTAPLDTTSKEEKSTTEEMTLAVTTTGSTDTDELISYAGPIVLGCSVVFLTALVIPILLCLKRRKTKFRFSDEKGWYIYKPSSNETWTIYKGKQQQPTNEIWSVYNGKQQPTYLEVNFSQATRINTKL